MASNALGFVIEPRAPPKKASCEEPPPPPPTYRERAACGGMLSVLLVTAVAVTVWNLTYDHSAPGSLAESVPPSLG